KQMPYQPLADLLIDFDRADGAADYRRELDLDAATATTRFRSEGRNHLREVFASPDAQCIVVRVSTDKPGGISLRGGIDSPQEGEVTA
ncbi:glycoside hydrolase N-terminal domain-containing protein, partial [Burkholderia sp. SIMBA_024]|uniref:glycoside hydrolase N-terminal domain-containing protein n=1 Tax=Burkholderia sp. SIMBA_024 TaxID=3085768 RepID=UPI00397A2408